MHEKLLDEIEAYIIKTGMAAATFGSKAAGSSTFMARLRQGKVTGRIIDRARQYMRDNPPRQNGAGQ